MGAYTNNLPNKEGLKKLCAKVNEGGSATTYTAGDNIQISAENVISATDTKYTGGTNVEISEQNVISATDTKYTAGTNVEISEQNVISATDTKYTAGTGITISEQNVISATGGSGGDWIEQISSNWSSLFDIENNKLKALKDILIYSDEGSLLFCVTKNSILGDPNGIKSDLISAYKQSNAEAIVFNRYNLTPSQITSDYISLLKITFTFSIVDNVLSVSTTNSPTLTLKSYLKVYYKN